MAAQAEREVKTLTRVFSITLGNVGHAHVARTFRVGSIRERPEPTNCDASVYYSVRFPELQKVRKVSARGSIHSPRARRAS